MLLLFAAADYPCIFGVGGGKQEDDHPIVLLVIDHVPVHLVQRMLFSSRRRLPKLAVAHCTLCCSFDFRLHLMNTPPVFRFAYTPMQHIIPSSHANHSSLHLAGNEYSSATGHPNQSTHEQSDLSSPPTGRYAQSFYPSYPQQPGVGGSSMPSVHDTMDPMHSQASALATPARDWVKKEDEEHKRNLFGDVPESKRRKFILVDDNQRGTRVRVRVMLEQVKMDDMPDAHLRINAVYPRSYFPRQMRSPPGSPGARGNWDDEDDEGDEGQQPLPSQGKTLVPVSLMDGSEAKLPVPRMTRSRRNKEVALNELGYRMSWGQARTFNGICHLISTSLDPIY